MAGPHVIVLMADQLRADVLSPYGSRQCPTPHLERLARRATLFEAHYSPCPLGVPARASLMTGLYPQQHGAIINGLLPKERDYGRIREGLGLLPNHLAEADYRVVHVGVQPLRSKEDDFEILCPEVEFLGARSPNQHKQMLVERGLIFPELSAFRDPVIDYDDGQPVVSGGTSARVGVFPLREDLFYDCTLASEMAKVIAEHRSGEPLCLFGNFWLPHPPLWAPRRWAEMIHPESLKLPSTIGRWYAGMPVMQLANIPGQLGAHVMAEQWPLAWAVYLGMTALLDQCVGEVIAALERAGIYDEAVVVFTSTHGDMLGSHRLLGRNCLYEEVVRVPLILKLPGQRAAYRVTELSDHLDLTRTICELAGAEPLAEGPAQSLQARAAGERSNEPRPQVFASSDGNAGRGFAHRMVRTSTHKFIHNFGDRPELYDLVDDPRETRNLAGGDEHKTMEATLRGQLNQWMDEVGDEGERC